MPLRGKLMNLIGVIFIILIFLCGWWFFSGDVETVLTVDEVNRGWLLSPGGDKITYGTGNGYTLMFLATGLRHKLEGTCGGSTWLDNTTFVCNSYIIVTNETVDKVSINSVKAAAVNLEEILAKAGTIYKLEQYQFIVVLDADYKHNPDGNYWVTEVKNIDDVLQGHNYISIPPTDYNPRSGKIYSPNKAYYYEFTGTVITLYEATSDKKFSQTPRDKRLYQIGGWAADNSGVYYQLVPKGFVGNISPLYKLKVPQPFPFW